MRAVRSPVSAAVGPRTHGQCPVEDGQREGPFKPANCRVDKVVWLPERQTQAGQIRSRAARDTTWPEAVIRRQEARRAPQPPAKSEPPQVAAESRLKPAVAPDEPALIVLAGGIVAFLGDNLDTRTIDPDLDLAVLAVEKADG